jgi:hypothetical protein
VNELVLACALITGMVGAVYAIARVGVWLWGTLRKLSRLADDLLGEPARPGHPEATPGVLDRLTSIEAYLRPLPLRLDGLEARLAAVEAQLHPNGGSSLRDAVDRLTPAESGG